MSAPARRDRDPGAEQKRRATEAQQQALDAAATIWVDASAGSGKTKVLVDRVLALLLAGARAERILCLTFTKAAAAEMANRLLQRLSAWATLSDDGLFDALHSLLGRRPGAEEERTARRLFARVLDTPGGLKIQTIHGFCQSLLARFPLEAGIAPGFAVLDERTAGELLVEAQNDLLAGIEAPGQERLRVALDSLLEAGDDQGLAKTLVELVRRRALLESALERYAGPHGATAALRAALELGPDDTPERLVADALGPELPPEPALRAALAALRGGGANDNKAADKLEAFLETPSERQAARYEAYRGLLLTDKNAPRAKVMTKSTAQGAPEEAELLAAEAERIAALECRLAALRLAEGAAALFELAAAVLTRYRRAQERRAALDYDDLIERTAKLLTQPGRAAWVLFKLDGGLDHLLIDEAQDTSPAQWQVVRALTAEFYAGAGAHEERSATARTVFAVGDAKQSIFRFQGADPAGFRSAQDHFLRLAEAIGQPFRPVALTHSFRSVEAVLTAVDLTFAPEAMREGLVAPETPIAHRVTRLKQGGLVELWPLVQPLDAEPEDPWSPPLERSDRQAPEVRLAETIALTLRRWLEAAPAELGPGGHPGGHPGWLESQGRPLAAGDVLILVRRRAALFWSLVRQLKKHGVPVSGVDRMVLNEQQAVRDLVALGRFLLLPEDDLTLAVVLKGPLFGLDDDDLVALAARRRGSLWQALGERRALKPAYGAARERLEALLGEADYRPPFEFFAGLLAAGGARRQWLARLGEEASDPLDEFLAQAQVYEREHAPSLEGFLDWLERGELQVKRDLESGGGAVRIMTVHGAKGLQAPVVLLPDTTQPPSLQEAYLTDAERCLLLPRTADTKATPLGQRLLAAEERATGEEYRRLLYVAMTRAEDRLYVMGTGRGADKEIDAGCWYAAVERALESAGEAVTLEGPAAALGTGRRLSVPQRFKPSAAAPRSSVPARPLGDFAHRPPPAEPTPPRPLTPSRPAVAEPAPLSPLAQAGRGEEASHRFRRGLVLHRLLQSLPELPEDARAAAARRYLALPGLSLSPREQESWAAEALAVMATPGAAPLFAAGSRAEVPLTGLVGTLRVAGQVDRLAVTPEAVLLVDYKTNRPPPRDESGVPEAYWRQMAAYRALLRQIYADRPVKAYLLWTDGARLMQLSDERLAAALP